MIGDLVIVRWEDTTNVADWQDRDEIAEFATDGAWLCENVGWVVFESDECVVVSARKASADRFGLTERIPRRAVIAIDTLMSG